MQSKSTFFHFFQRNEILCVTSPTHIRPPQHTHNTIILFIILLKGKQKLFHPSPQSCTWPFSLSLSLSHSHPVLICMRHLGTSHTPLNTLRTLHTISLSLSIYKTHRNASPIRGLALTISLAYLLPTPSVSPLLSLTHAHGIQILLRFANVSH